MGDRNNPIKFGPEWLRNLAHERSVGTSTNSQNAPPTPGTSSPGGLFGAGVNTATASSSTATMPNTSNTLKVQLAKLRYGREEMLALYDRTSEAPPELKSIEVLYQPRGKPPLALNNSFEEDMRETMRSGSTAGLSTSGDRFGIGRSLARGSNITEPRTNKPRPTFMRSPSMGRGGTLRHMGSPRTPGYSGNTEEDPSSQPARPWHTLKGSPSGRNVGEQMEWAPNKMYTSKRSGNSTNWRQSREEEEWRASDGARTRPTHQDKWDREWGDRAQQDKPQSWSLNRRSWVSSDTQGNEDNLPEWAVDNAEACGGTFDSSGAFHGYSNDDTNLPKNQESGYALTRSHTHGSFARSKTAEEGSEEWWNSEKPKKAFQPVLDFNKFQFSKKVKPVVSEQSLSSGSNSDENAGKENTSNSKGLETTKSSNSGAMANSADLGENNSEEGYSKRIVRFTESKTFDALMRSDITLEESSDERGNFQSVMITPNNSLRQKHQNIVSSANSTRQPILQLLQNTPNKQNSDSDLTKKTVSEDNNMVDNFMDLGLEDREVTPKTSDSLMANMPSTPVASSIANVVNSVTQMSSSAMQLRMSSPVHSVQSLTMTSKSNISNPSTQHNTTQSPSIQNIGMTSSALNASLGLPIGPTNNAVNQSLGLPIQTVPPSVLPNTGMSSPNVGTSVLQTGGPGMSGYASGGVLPGMSGTNVNNSIFNAPPLQNSNDIQIGHGNPSNMFPMHGLPHSGSQTAFNSSIYSNIMQQSPAPNPPTSQNLADQWYYEDPKGQIQGPFASKEMYNWYRAGFFTSYLMVRRACETHMRPLGSYGPVVPFKPMDILSSFQLASGFDANNPAPQDAMLTSQPGLGLDVESLWSQPSPTPDLMWMQQSMNARNNLPMFFWDQQPSAIAPNSLLPEDIAKEMKTEEQILAQLRASKNMNTTQKLPFMNEQAMVPPPPPPPPVNNPEDTYPPSMMVARNLEDLQKLIQDETVKNSPVTQKHSVDVEPLQAKLGASAVVDHVETESEKSQIIQNNKSLPDTKPSKQVKIETDKSAKNKENNSTKNKSSKKAKDDKKEEIDIKTKDDDVPKPGKRQDEPSPSKNKKEEKQNKKELEKEKKEWIKEGFTIVKTEKNNKDSKKKNDDTKAAEEADRKRKDEERLAAEEEKKRKQAESLKKQQETQQQSRQQMSESIARKAPWSAVTNQTVQSTNKDGLTLAEIQRMEREKKLEQMKEQQQMMQIIAQQQAVALAREQEMQAGLGWAKKKANSNSPGQSLAEIQAEARKQAAATAAVPSPPQNLEDIPVPPQPQTHSAPWANTHNGGGFWDTQPSQPQAKVQEPAKAVDNNKIKKKPVVVISAKKETSPAAEFETWCTSVLTSWSTKIDVPTFVGFLKDIESPYEIKDYVKCYLGDSKDSSDFARQFLERRSKLLRVGMVTPSDDLCSPAIAVNPRTTSGSDYQEVKNKSKKTKKSKMLKVDNRILGFSVTAAEDRINVGDIDTV